MGESSVAVDALPCYAEYTFMRCFVFTVWIHQVVHCGNLFSGRVELFLLLETIYNLFLIVLFFFASCGGTLGTSSSTRT